ncbi:MAG: GNAT family N-acetyltransferase [Ktedonobacteraceae bacterium]
MAITIREARLEDAEGVAKVYIAGWRTTYPGIVPDDYLANMSVEEHTKRWQNILGSDDGFVYVAEDEPGIVAGFIWGGDVRDKSDPAFTGELHAIYVLKSYQGHDIGRRLVRVLAQQLLGVGIQSMIVWVLAANPARRFYEKLGAKLLKTAPYQVPGIDLFLDDTGYGWTNVRVLLEDNHANR